MQANSLFEAFFHAVQHYGQRTQIIQDMNSPVESYQILLKKTLALGRLSSKISQEGEVLGVLMPNVTPTIALILGISAFGRIPAMLNYTAGPASVQDACTAANIQTVITSKAMIAKANLGSLITALSHLKIVYLEDLRTQFNWRDKIWLMGLALPFPQWVMKKSAPAETAVILFTSGSEGKPKAVLHSHNSILSNIKQINAVLDFNPSDQFIMVLPIFHAFGFTGTLLPVLNGISVYIFPSPLLYKQIPEEIDKKACTVLFATNTFLNHYAKYADPRQFNSLRYVIAGAEKLSDSVRHLYQEKYNIHILEGYGATECAPVLSVNTPNANKPGSVGRFVPDIAYRLKPVSGIDQGGVLQVKGPNMMQGYYYHHQPTMLCPPTDGWHDTGDIVHVDEDGFIFILGREKRFAKVAGEMVSLMVVEQIAQVASPDFEHAASTQTDAQRGETIVLFTTDAKLTREDLQTAAKKLGCAEIAIARKIMRIAEIPILSTGKTDYAQIKTLAELA